MTTTQVGPVAQAARIGALDVLRGVAVCGILLMNIPMMGMAFDVGRPAYPVSVGPDWIAFSVQNLAFEGSMRGLFTLLFGAGMLVMLRHAEGEADARARQAYFTRCFALMLLGVANAVLFMWPGEILTNYGIAGLILYLFRRADLRVIAVAAAAILILSSVAMGAPAFERAETFRTAAVAAEAKAAGKKLTEEQTEALAARDETLAYLHPTPAKVKAEVAKRTSLPGLLIWSTEKWVEYNFSAVTLAFLAETVSFMLLGLLLYRTGVLGGERSLRFYALMALGGYGAGFLIRGALLAWQWAHLFEPTAEGAIMGAFTYELGRLPVTLGLTGLVVLLFKAGALGWLADGLTAIGRLALTNYMTQSVIAAILFYAFGLLNQLTFIQLMGVCVLIWIAQGIFSVLWLKRYEMGPFEWLLRSLTYGVWRPLARAPSPALT